MFLWICWICYGCEVCFLFLGNWTWMYSVCVIRLTLGVAGARASGAQARLWCGRHVCNRHGPQKVGNSNPPWRRMPYDSLAILCDCESSQRTSKGPPTANPPSLKRSKFEWQWSWMMGLFNYTMCSYIRHFWFERIVMFKYNNYRMEIKEAPGIKQNKFEASRQT